jgi:hypothetical protein
MRVGRIIKGVGALALAGFAFAAFTAPASGAPAREVNDTFTHVDVRVADGGLTVTPSTVPAGLVEITVIDARTDHSSALSVRSVPPPVNAGPGTTLYTLRALRRYALAAFADNRPLSSGNAGLTIVVPDVRAPREEAHVVRVDVRNDAIITPRREMKRQQPFVPFITNPVPADDQLWTKVATGETTVRVHNTTNTTQHCAVNDGTARSVTVKPHSTKVLGAALEPNDVRFLVLTCNAGGSIRQFDFWLI